MFNVGVGAFGPRSRIRSLGLASAQGSAADLQARTSFDPARPLPWPERRWTTSRYCRPAIDASGFSGAKRWNALARRALEECFAERLPLDPPPIVVASCNGGAPDAGADAWLDAFDAGELLKGTPWQDQPAPVVSASCASGLQALYLAQRLLAAGTKRVVVLAADILSARSQDHFEALHVLAPEPQSPWRRSPGAGFITGEAAVALLLEQSSDDDREARLGDVSLDHDLLAGDGLSRVVSAQSRPVPGFVLGMGTGPESVDDLELEALARCVPREVPIASAIPSFGHTLGASGVLSLALAALSRGRSRPISTEIGEDGSTTDGRPISRELRGDGALVLCRALTGACAAVSLRSVSNGSTRGAESAGVPARSPECVLPVSRRIAQQLDAMRPPRLPGVLVVRLHAPLGPAPSAQVGGRLLPSAVVEITPGFVLSLAVRSWRYVGPSLCLVADERCDPAVEEWIRALRTAGLDPGMLSVRGRGEERSVHWSA